ncbi:MAG: type II secretion system F family protein [Planctomycetota bacterium]|nr:MAG: type II secretion system F family protein [Planctomycetota bacterium]
MSAKQYKYTGLDRSGKRVGGVVAAADSTTASRKLIESGVTPLEVRSARQARRGFSLHTGKTVTQQDIASLTRELSVLVQANIPIARGLRSVAEHEKKATLRDMVADIAAQIESGEKLTGAFGKYERTFGNVYIETIRAAEKSGTLAEVTMHLADMLERNIETRAQLRRAMTYPAIVMTFVAIAMTVIVVFVVPRFATIFEANNVPLPVATRVITALGTAVRGYWWGIGAALALGVFASVTAWRSPVWRYRIERLALRIPYISSMLTAVTAARFSRVLSIGLDSGIEVIEAMSIAGNATGRPVFARECQQICDRMRSGDSLEAALSESRRLPSFARRLLSAGKDSSELSATGRIIASHYDRICDHLSKNINTIIEPLVTVAIACMVLLVALSVFLPMWKMVALNS